MWGSQSPHEVDRSHDQGGGGVAATHDSDGELRANPLFVRHFVRTKSHNSASGEKTYVAFLQF